MALQGIASVLQGVIPAVEEAGLFASTCTIMQRATTTVGSFGQPNTANYSAIDSLTDIPCMFAPQTPGETNQNDTVRMQQQLDTRTEFHCLLDGYFPQILQQNLAMVDGTLYEIMGNESDSQRQMTRLACREYTL